MSITLRCACAKSLKVPDKYGGKRVKCPACGKPVTVPAPPEVEELPLLDYVVQEKPRCAACGAEMEDAAVVCVQCGFNKRLGIPPERWKILAAATPKDAARAVLSGEKDPRGWFAVITESLPATRSMLIFALVGAAIWGAITVTRRWSDPPPVHSYTLGYVDAYGVGGVVDSLDPEEAEKQSNRLVFGGSLTGQTNPVGAFVLTRPSQSRRFIKVDAELNKRYFEMHGAVDHDVMNISASRFTLVGADGSGQPAMFLTGVWKEPPAYAAFESYAKDKTFPSEAEGMNTWRHPGEVVGALTARQYEDMEDQQLHFAGFDGACEYRGDSGMQLTFEGTGGGVEVTWDKGSTGWRTASGISMDATMFSTFGQVPVTILFPVPPGGGPYKIKVGTDELLLKE